MATRIRPTLTVTIDADIRAQLDRMKEKESVNVSDFVNRALRWFLKARKK